MERSQKFDFYISYNREAEEDRKWAEWIYWQLQERGYSTSLPLLNDLGASPISDIPEHINSCEHVIAVISPNSFVGNDGILVRETQNLAYRIHLDRKPRFLLPIRVENYQVTSFLGNLSSTDLFGLNECEARSRLLDSIQEVLSVTVAQGRATTPSDKREPSFPGIQFISGEETFVKIFAQERQKLAALMDQQRILLKKLEMSAWDARIEKLQRCVLSDSIKVLILGEIGRGKTTFINALLRMELLPAHYWLPTRIVTEVKWGPKEKVTLHYQQPSEISPRQSRDIPLSQATSYLESLFDDFYTCTSIDTDYEKIEVFWPLGLCQNGVEIIDTPDLNDETKSSIIYDLIPSADIVIFMISYEFHSDLRNVINTTASAIDIVKEAGHKDIFFIFNRQQNDIQGDDDDMRRNCRKVLRTIFGEEPGYMFIVNLKTALKTRLTGSPLPSEELDAIENDLKNILVTKRCFMKLTRPSFELQASILHAKQAYQGLLTQTKQYSDQQRQDDVVNIGTDLAMIENEVTDFINQTLQD